MNKSPSIAHVDHYYLICPMGPHSYSRCIVSVESIDETEETLVLADTRRTLKVSFEDFRWMKPTYVSLERAIRFQPKVKNAYHAERMFELPCTL